MDLTIRLWELLKENNMTARELSKSANISTQQLSYIRNGKTTKISFETLAKFLEIFKCTPNDLFNITKIKNGK